MTSKRFKKLPEKTSEMPAEDNRKFDPCNQEKLYNKI